MILARAAYLGAQRNGTVFWSSDIVSTWDMLKRSIPAGPELHRDRTAVLGHGHRGLLLAVGSGRITTQHTNR